MTETAAAQPNRFTTKCAAQFNRLSLRNGVSLNGLARNPFDLEVFFQTALFFVSAAGRESQVDRDVFLARLEDFRSRHAAWLAGTTDEIFEWLQGCGLIAVDGGVVRFTMPSSSDFGSLKEVETEWSEMDAERTRRRHRMRVQLQAKNRLVNAPKTVEVDPELDRVLMQEALRMAEIAVENDEVPVGAVIAMDGNIVATAINEVVMRHDPTAHAEMQALTAATGAIGGKYLNECRLYVTVEPCVMCAGACFWCQVGQVIYGAPDPKRGASLHTPSLFHPKTQVRTGILEQECREWMERFFRKLRF